MFSKQAGYTLVEIIIALAIFSLLLGYAVLNLRGASDSDRVKLTTDKVTTLLRKARNAAFNGVIDPFISEYPTGGYGLYFDVAAKQVVFFGDQDGEGDYDTGEAAEEIFQLPAELSLVLAGTATVTRMIILYDGQQPPVVKNAVSGADIPSEDRYVEVKAANGCTGRISISEDTGPLFVKTVITTCS